MSYTYTCTLEPISSSMVTRCVCFFKCADEVAGMREGKKCGKCFTSCAESDGVVDRLKYYPGCKDEVTGPTSSSSVILTPGRLMVSPLTSQTAQLKEGPDPRRTGLMPGPRSSPTPL